MPAPRPRLAGVPCGPSRRSHGQETHRHGLVATAAVRRPAPRPTLRLASLGTPRAAPARPAIRARAGDPARHRARGARHPRPRRPVRRRPRGHGIDHVRGAGVRRRGLPAGVHRAREPRPRLSGQRGLERETAAGARHALALARARLRPAEVERPAARARAGRAHLGPRVPERHFDQGAAARQGHARRRLRTRAGHARHRGVPRLARGTLPALAEDHRAVQRRRGGRLAVPLPRRRPLPRALRVRRGRRQRRRLLGRPARVLGLAGRARPHRGGRARRARGPRAPGRRALRRERGADRARPAPRARGRGGRDRLHDARAGGRAHPARALRRRRHGARPRPGPALRSSPRRRALERARRRRARACVPRALGAGRGPPRPRPGRAPGRLRTHHRGALRARPARANGSREGPREARGARARALLRARRVPPARGVAPLGGGRPDVKIVRLRVDGFGALQGEWTFSPDRLNVILDDNERGKSSLFAAIGAALYGLEGDRCSHRVVTPIERWRPWNGDAFRVTLDVDTADGRLTITRDFDRGTVAVFDRTGREATADFLEGRDEYPVGKRLFGLDAAEFEKTALLLQGELDVVVPGDEKARRASTLKSRLESAADTHIGDTNATEALKVLEEALRKYNAQELEFTGTIDNAIDRLAAKRELVEVEIRELDNTLAGAQAPLERLHQLTEDERRLQDKLRDLENERRAGLAADVKRQLDDHESARAEVARLEAEASELAGMANLPPNTEVELREAITRHEEATRGLEGLESRRQAELAREREAIDAERKELSAYEDFTQEEADRCVGQAAELRNLVMPDALLRHQVVELRDGLAVKGYEPEKAQYLQERFAALPSDKLRLMRQQSELNLLFQTEATTLEQQRTGATETLRAVDAARAARRTPGWSLLALGGAGLVAGGVVLALALSATLGVALLAAGGAMAAAGGALLAVGARTREQDREQALAQLAEAQSRINQLHHRRAENEAGLLELSRVMGYRDHVDLVRLWNDYSRLNEDAGPLVRAQEQLETTERRKNHLVEEARPVLEATGEAEVTPELLEKVAFDARRSLNARQRLADLERGF